ncbi:hypothetical protein E8E13_006786 [Curvularia kusanoi]|uniref:2EXR domain-containing protein n=1 Tax=Curvularia kusanoi TaxID=90978 RepID=A0A9P4TDG6_CURKU|nr:hypothetical protein E8E13_006786 [Curvularia kusanoi]
MAPSKPSLPPEPVGRDIVSDSSKVAKRPKRRYHRFGNGALNVTPKGRDENEIFRRNQSSPLLQLPPEIRDSIWRYALGNKVFLAKYNTRGKGRFVPSKSESNDSVALLRTCRQVYSEAATHHLTLGWFVFDEYWAVQRSFGAMKPWQRKQIKQIRLSVDKFSTLTTWDRESITFFSSLASKHRKLPSAVKEVEFLFHYGEDTADADIQTRADQSLEHFKNNPKGLNLRNLDYVLTARGGKGNPESFRSY